MKKKMTIFEIIGRGIIAVLAGLAIVAGCIAFLYFGITWLNSI